MAPVSVPSIKLNTGVMMPQVGLGTFQSKPGEVKEAVRTALMSGYRHLDCAQAYGNEAEVGEGIKLSGFPRDQIFITSKLWNTDHAAADVEPACRETLRKLGTDYLDLYLMHWPVSMRKGATMPPAPDAFIDVPIEETWKAMEALVDKGLCKAIGVSNFSVQNIERILRCARVKPAMNQVEAHPYLQQLQLKKFCESHGIRITAFAPLASPERPANLKKASDPVLLEDETLAAIAKSLGRSPADVVLSWGVQRGTVVIPKSVTAARIERNLMAACEPLPQEAMEKLEAMDRHLRLFAGAHWAPAGTTGPIKDAKMDLWGEAPVSKM